MNTLIKSYVKAAKIIIYGIDIGLTGMTVQYDPFAVYFVTKFCKLYILHNDKNVL